VYDYQSQGPDELDVSEGNRIELTSGPSGGQNYGDGWWEGQLQRTPASSRAILTSFSGIDGLGRKGIFPSNYVSAHFFHRARWLTRCRWNLFSRWRCNLDATPQFDQVWSHLCDEEGNTITRKGQVRIESRCLCTCFAFRRATS
jgi:hypothetical protein